MSAAVTLTRRSRCAAAGLSDDRAILTGWWETAGPFWCTVRPEGEVDNTIGWWPPNHGLYDEARELLGRLGLSSRELRDLVWGASTPVGADLSSARESEHRSEVRRIDFDRLYRALQYRAAVSA